jgi:purine-binding chemotaxis protein CheW
MPDALLKIDRAGLIAGDVSSKCFSYLGQESLTGQDFAALFFKDHPALRREWAEAYPLLWEAPERARDPDLPLPRAASFQRGRTDLRHYTLSLYPCYEGARLVGFDVAISDLTEQKRVQEERARMERALKNVKHRFLTFRLADETYGIEIDRAREILERAPLTRVPNAPPFLCGVLNLRGRILPTLDLRVLLGLAPRAERDQGWVFIAEIEAEGRPRLFGLRVDEVTDILDIPEGEIEPPPDFGNGIVTPFIQGLARTKGGVSILLALDRLLTTELLEGVEALRGAAPTFTPEGDAR